MNVLGKQKRIAVVGSGIAGLSAATNLARDHAVTLYEANDYLGGHTHTVDVVLEGQSAPVDTGFLVFNDRTYPHLIQLFQELGVESCASEMSFAVKVAADDLEWGGRNLGALFAQRKNLWRPRFWGMLWDIWRFNRTANQQQLADTCELTLGQYLDQGAYGQAFRHWYLLPMAGAIWSSPSVSMLDYPARTFIAFCQNHGLLQIQDRPQWRTVVGGARTYVELLAAQLTDIRLNQPVTGIVRHAVGVTVYAGANCAGETFDALVLACHSDQALILLDAPDPQEQALLGAIRYQANHAVLHTDRRCLPQSQAAWSAWNYHAEHSNAETGLGRPVGVTYLINLLQPLPFAQPVMVTLNAQQIDPKKIIAEFQYAHPVFDLAAIAAQKKMISLQGHRHTWYCGAWMGYGFHEDGLKSALAIVPGVREALSRLA